MTVELVCRLLESKVLLRTEVAATLLDATTRQISFVQSMVERISGATVLLESEFSRWRGSSATSIRVDEELVRQLPMGMCERLLALPLQRRANVPGRELAVVDPFDTHVLAEFEFCLSVVLTPVRVAYPVLVAAIDAVRSVTERNFDVLLDVPDDEETPAFGTRMIRVTRKPERERPRLGEGRPRRGLTVPSLETPREASEPPIPLVRTTLAPAGMRRDFPVEQTPLPGRLPRDSEPILRLVKQKPPLTMRRVSIPVPPRFGVEEASRPEDVLQSLEEATTPRRLIELLRAALQRIAPSQAYFSVRSGNFVLEWASSLERSDELTLSAEQQAMLDRACNTGYSLGPLPSDGAARALGAAMGLRAREEIYVAPIAVSNRPVLVVVVARFDEAFTATRWVDSVAARAGQVLERIVRKRKDR